MDDPYKDCPRVKNVEELFRLAHRQEFGRDILSFSAAYDVSEYQMNKRIPWYVDSFLKQFKI